MCSSTVRLEQKQSSSDFLLQRKSVKLLFCQFFLLCGCFKSLESLDVEVNQQLLSEPLFEECALSLTKSVPHFITAEDFLNFKVQLAAFNKENVTDEYF